MISKRMNGFIGILAYAVVFFFIGTLIQLIVFKSCEAYSNIPMAQIISPKEELLIEGTLLFNMHYLAQAVSNMLIYAVLFIVLILIFKSDLIEYFKNIKESKYKFIIYAFGLGIILYVVSFLISYIYQLNNIGNSNNQEIIINMVKVSPIFVFFSVVIFAPFCEEMIFRKCIYDVSGNKIIYYICSSLIFGLIHMTSTKGIETSTWILMLVPYVLSGLILSICFERTNNIYASIICHMINNLIAFIILFI